MDVKFGMTVIEFLIYSLLPFTLFGILSSIFEYRKFAHGKENIFNKIFSLGSFFGSFLFLGSIIVITELMIVFSYGFFFGLTALVIASVTIFFGILFIKVIILDK